LAGIIKKFITFLWRNWENKMDPIRGETS
jgi:hypothetical protein